MGVLYMLKRGFFTGILACFFCITAPSIEAYTTNMSASVVVGQQTFSGTSSNQGGSAGSRTLSYPYGVSVITNKLVVSDFGNNRILIYDPVPTDNNAAATTVIGQQNFTSTNANQGSTANANTLNGPGFVDTDGTKLFVADYSNNRVLIYNSLPASSNANADVVIGQSGMTGSSPATAQNRLRGPFNVDYDPVSGKLVIADYDNSRVLIYNSVPTTNGANANVVVGQLNYTSSSGSVAQNRLNAPYSARIIDGKLLVADTTNSRVLIWNSVPTTNGVNADVVIGQSDFTSSDPNQNGAAGPNTLSYPTDIGYVDGQLFIVDSDNNRVLVYDGIPTTNNAAAFKVIGQPDFTSIQPNQGGSAAANTLGYVDGSIFFHNDMMFITDSDNDRVLIYQDEPDPTPTPTATPTLTPTVVPSAVPTATSVPQPTARPLSKAPATESQRASNCPEHYKYCVDVGPKSKENKNDFVSGSENTGSVQVYIPSAASPHDLHIEFKQVNLFDMFANPLRIVPFPWSQGLNTAGEIFTITPLSAFNGYPVVDFKAPGIVIIPFDPAIIARRNIDASLLRIAVFNTETRKWEVLKDNTVLNWKDYTLANITERYGYFVVVYRAK